MANLDLTWAVRGVDAILRQRQGIEEFTDDPQCIFRISAARTARKTSLSDGTSIGPEDLLVEIHYWNEHMPIIPRDGRNTAWANQFKHRLHRSLTLVAEHLATDPRYHGAVALYGEPAFSERIGPDILTRICTRIGFDVALPDRKGGPVHAWLDSLLVSGLIWAFNPAGLRSHGLSHGRMQIWMSRATLMGRYGRRAERH